MYIPLWNLFLPSFSRLKPTTCAFACSLLFAAAMNAQISITSFGAVPNGSTDNTAAINSAFAYATAHPGTKITFPCSSGNTYLIKSAITFPPHTTIEGDNAIDCRILFSPMSNSARANTAFSFVGSSFVTVHDLALETSSSNPPQTITEMGGKPGAAGQHILQNVTIKGFATEALSYAVGSEVDTWKNVYWEYDGGGATYGFYTIAQDDFNLCPGCTPGSNLSLFFSSNSFVVFGNTPFTAISDKIGGGTGDHYFGQNYIGLNKNQSSIAFEFTSGEQNQGGPNAAVHVTDTRIENGGYALYFRKGFQASVSNVAVDNLTWDSNVSNSGYFAFGDSGLALRQFRMTQNNAYQSGITGPSSFDSLIDSSLEEHYGQITIRRVATCNTMIMHGAASVVLPGTVSANSISMKGVWSTH